MRVADTNYFVIQGWMRTELDLSGNDLLVYALIYGVTQHENSEFYASQQYLADWCGCTTRGIRKNLDNLTKMGLIREVDRPIGGTVHYKAIRPKDGVGTKFKGDENKVPQGVEQNSDNNIVIDKIINKNTIPKGIVTEVTTEDDVTENNSLNTLSEYESKMYSEDRRKITKIDTEQPKKKKLSLWDKCVQIINDFTEDEELRKVLTEFLRMRLSMRDKVMYAPQWKSMLERMARLNGNPVNIVRQSLEHGWAGFYDEKPNGSYGYRQRCVNDTTNETDDMNSNKITKEEWEEMQKNGEVF